MPTMIVLVNLKEGVSPEEYEHWVLESYAPAARSLPSVENWWNYRVNGLLASDAPPPLPIRRDSRDRERGTARTGDWERKDASALLRVAPVR